MDKKLNFSSRRVAIYNTIRDSKRHPSAKMVYDRLKGDYPNLSLGTVYRNISLFKEKGLVTAAANVNGEERLDADTSPHVHFICKCCGEVIDVGDDEATVENAGLERKGFVIDSCSISLYGTCNKCRIPDTV